MTNMENGNRFFPITFWLLFNLALYFISDYACFLYYACQIESTVSAGGLVCSALITDICHHASRYFMRKDNVLARELLVLQLPWQRGFCSANSVCVILDSCDSDENTHTHTQTHRQTETQSLNNRRNGPSPLCIWLLLHTYINNQQMSISLIKCTFKMCILVNFSLLFSVL